MNMSYCRFQNTLEDLKDCFDNWNDELSKEEQTAKSKLIELCIDITIEESELEEMD